MENILTTLDHFTLKHLSPNTNIVHHQKSCKHSHPTPRGKVKVDSMLLVASVFSTSVADSQPLARYIPQ